MRKKRDKDRISGRITEKKQLGGIEGRKGLLGIGSRKIRLHGMEGSNVPGCGR